jgi:hypothetical protein
MSAGGTGARPAFSHTACVPRLGLWGQPRALIADGRVRPDAMSPSASGGMRPDATGSCPGAGWEVAIQEVEAHPRDDPLERTPGRVRSEVIGPP